MAFVLFFALMIGCPMLVAFVSAWGDLNRDKELTSCYYENIKKRCPIAYDPKNENTEAHRSMTQI